jgi:hypothetical protein
MKHSMAQRTPALTADQLTAKHLVTMSEHPLVMEQVSVSVELSAEQASSPPSPSAMTGATLAGIRGAKERALQRQLRQAGGEWNPTERVCEMSYA